MNIKLEETGPLTADLILTVESADYKDQVKATLKEQAKKASLPGFRPGKVPLAVVRKMVGTSVVIEELNKIVAQSVQSFIEEEKLEVLGDPLPKDQKKEEDFDPKAEKDMTFTFELGLAPEFEVNLELSDIPPQYQVEIDEAYLDKELNIYKEHFGETSTPEEFELGDIVFGKVFEADENGEPLEGGFDQMIPLNPKRIENEEFFKAFEGGKIDSVFDFDAKKISEDPGELKSILFQNEDVIEKLLDANLKVEIKRLNRVKPAEINEEFLKKLTESMKWELEEEQDMTEELARKKMAETLEAQFNDAAKNRFKNKLVEALIKQHELEFPDEFLKKWLQATNEEATEESVEKDYPKFSDDLTYTLIEGKLIEKFDIKVENEDVEKTLRSSLEQNLVRSGMPVDDNMMNTYLDYARKDRDTMNRMFRTALTNNVLDKMVEEFNPEISLINATDFIELGKESE